MTALDTLERENVYFVKLLKTSTAFNEEVFAIRTDDVDSLLQVGTQCTTSAQTFLGIQRKFVQVRIEASGAEALWI